MQCPEFHRLEIYNELKIFYQNGKEIGRDYRIYRFKTVGAAQIQFLFIKMMGDVPASSTV